MRRSPVAAMLISIPAAVALVGCISVADRSLEQTQYYVMDPELPAAVDASPYSSKSLLFGRVTSADTANRSSFLVRTGDTTVREDFYHRWLVKPGRAIEDQLYAWLTRSDMFGEVVRSGSGAATDYRLETHLTRCEIDLRGDGEAVVALHLRLVDLATGESVSELYEGRAPLDRRTPEAMAEAWSRALETVLEEAQSSLLD